MTASNATETASNTTNNLAVATANRPAKKSKGKKAKAKKASNKKPAKQKSHAGRKPGVWSAIQPGTLRPWREGNNISRASLAATLGVSSASIQNWEVGVAIPSTKYQEALAALMTGGKVTALVPAGKVKAASVNAAGVNARKSAGAADMTVVGNIVVSFIEKSNALTSDDLAKIINTVRNALA